LYAVHSIFGYALMVYLLRHGMNSWATMVLTLTIVILLSYLVYLFVEKPSIKLSRKFNR
jgi:peptidoglycan/LPS O-acetylase OafA/YrhL